MRAVVILWPGLLAAAAAAGCSSSPGQAAPSRPAPLPRTSPAPSPPASLASCRAADLRWRPGGSVVPMTGEHSETFYLANRGPAACAVRGYPSAVLYRAGGAVLPFRYADGGGMYVTASKPAIVVLNPGASAFLLLAKYRCDRGIASDAVSVRLSLRLPGGATVSRRRRLPVTGPPGLSYCTGGRRDPGQLVTISPLEPNPQAANPATGGN